MKAFGPPSKPDCPYDPDAVPDELDLGLFDEQLPSELITEVKDEQAPRRICFDEPVFDFPLPISFPPFGCVKPDVSVDVEEDVAEPYLEVEAVPQNNDYCNLLLDFRIGFPPVSGLTGVSIIDDVGVQTSFIYSASIIDNELVLRRAPSGGTGGGGIGTVFWVKVRVDGGTSAYDDPFTYSVWSELADPDVDPPLETEMTPVKRRVVDMNHVHGYPPGKDYDYGLAFYDAYDLVLYSVAGEAMDKGPCVPE